MIRLTNAQVNQKIDFIEHYIHSANAADGSKVRCQCQCDFKKHCNHGSRT